MPPALVGGGDRPMLSDVAPDSESTGDWPLSHHLSTPGECRDALSPLNLPPWPPPPPTCSAVSLLSLPTELLDDILRYLLPYTFDSPKGVTWRRASPSSGRTVAPLRTCRRLYALGAAILHGQNTFHLETSYAGSKWKQTWEIPRETIPPRLAAAAPGRRVLCNIPPVILSSSAGHNLRASSEGARRRPEAASAQLVREPTARNNRGPVVWGISHAKQRVCYSRLFPSTVFPFPDKLQRGCLKLIRKWYVVVHLEDEYKGMIKYGCGGPGLLDGMLRRVKELCEVLGECESISRLEVSVQFERLSSSNRLSSDVHAMLTEPFEALPNLTGGALQCRCKHLKTRHEPAV